MSEKIENPPAFPFKTIETHPNDKWSDKYNDGMTLRDYFVRGAMQALITSNYIKNEDGIDDVRLDPEDLATEAGCYADEMLKERSKK